MAKLYDFAGYVTKNNVRCNDGVVIRKNAFADQDGTTVPLVWQHNHDDPEAVIGHAVLENREDGVYGYVKLNDSDAGRAAKKIVDAGDVSSMSIWANNLKRSGMSRKDIVHGVIREVSLVLSGANPGALIEATNVVHDANGEWDEGIIWTDGVVRGDDVPDEIEHGAMAADDSDDILGSMNDVQKAAFYGIVGQLIGDEIQHGAMDSTIEDGLSTMNVDQLDFVEAAVHSIIDSDEIEHSADKEDEDMAEASDKTVGEVIDTMNEEQKNVLYALVGQALEQTDGDDEEDDNVKHNAFSDARDEGYENEDVISHDAMTEIINDAKRNSITVSESARRHGYEDISYIQHDGYGITNTDYLFPDYKSLTTTPTFVSRDMAWVDALMSSIRRTPFSRVKSLVADITGDDARALGYIKGKLKKEEVFTLLKRTTDPQTIYKKQKMDRDDVVDITDFDVIAWLKAEMQVMLREEIARCVLVGDGRLASSEDHVSETHVRPIWTDSDLYTIKATVEETADMTDDEKAKACIKAAIRARKDYKGSGNPVFFTTADQLTNMLLLEDGIGRPLYSDVNALASKLLVSKIVTVEVMDGLTRTGDDSKVHSLVGIIVNPRDYTIGTDKGGQTSLFDQFDIDYNQMKYLIETRISGAMTVPYGAIALETVAAA